MKLCELVFRYRPSYNVSPGFSVPVVRREDDPNDEGAVLHCMKWGLVPSFTKKTEKPDHYKMVNGNLPLIVHFFHFRGWFDFVKHPTIINSEFIVY